MHSDDIGCFKGPNVSFISSYISSHLIVQRHTANWRCVWCVRFRDWNCIFLNFTIFLLFRRFSLFFFTAPCVKNMNITWRQSEFAHLPTFFLFLTNKRETRKRLVFTSSRISLMFSNFSTRTISGFFLQYLFYFTINSALHLFSSKKKKKPPVESLF